MRGLDDLAMNYWLDLFTVKTLEEFQKAGANVSGFRDRRFQICQQIQPGDKLLCYITGISRWVGVLRVTKPAYRSEERIWDMEVFPVRLGVEPEILLPPEHGIPHQSLQPSLHSPARSWAGYLRGSPTRLQKDDAEVILDAIQRAQQTPVFRPIDKKKAERVPVANKGATSGEAKDLTTERPGLCPWLPTFSQLRGYLTAIEGTSVRELESLESAIKKLRGTPQEPISWENPEIWIEQRLEGTDQALAKLMWSISGHRINPSYSLEPGNVADRYDLIDEREGKWTVTFAGKDLLRSEFGATERGIDLQEGMGEILKLIQVKPNARRADLLPGWGEFAISHSKARKESVLKGLLYRRLQNLLDRKLIEREGQRYRLTQRGEDYLESLISGLPDVGQSRTRELLAGVELFNRKQREMLRERLENMDPYAFEHLVCDLLTEMGYDDVEVTEPSNDKGVDVKAVAQFGITTINEVIQVKRHRANIQRPALDMLRGSLHRFKAQKGTIITTGDYGKRAKDAAFEMGAAPITLINGETLIDLLLQHQIGVKKKIVDYYELDETAFQPEDSVEIEGADDEVTENHLT
jgi:restriction system protein